MNNMAHHTVPLSNKIKFKMQKHCVEIYTFNFSIELKGPGGANQTHLIN